MVADAAVVVDGRAWLQAIQYLPLKLPFEDVVDALEEALDFRGVLDPLEVDMRVEGGHGLPQDPGRTVEGQRDGVEQMVAI
jgi:hypothetical protein